MHQKNCKVGNPDMKIDFKFFRIVADFEFLISLFDIFSLPAARRHWLRQAGKFEILRFEIGFTLALPQ
jgi:hypothetical protein